jgi:hypothetical protein
MRNFILHISCLFILWNCHFVNAQTADSSKLPKLFFDCKADFCDLTFFRQELPYVNFVIDRRLSDVYVLMTSQQTGSGGNAFSMYFFDKKSFDTCLDTIVTNVPDNTSNGDTRAALLESLSKGLLPYLMRSSLKDKIKYTIDFKGASVNDQTKNDKWNFWSFNVRANGNGNIDANYKNYETNFNLSADRVTDKLKFTSGHFSGFNYARNKIDDTTFSTNRQYYSGFYHNLTFAINDHWAYGYYGLIFRGTFDNYKFNTNIGPAIEYNAFSIKEATRRQLRFINRVTVRHNQYYKTTIFNKDRETRFVNSFMIIFSEIEKWGSFNTRFGYFQYLHDSRVYRLSILPDVQINLFKGLSIELSGSASLVRDQINLAQFNITAEDVNLKRAVLATNYSFRGFIGFSYRFGSIYNNVINPRFELPDDFY